MDHSGPWLDPSDAQSSGWHAVMHSGASLDRCCLCSLRHHVYVHGGDATCSECRQLGH
jgi:hypothetical protein